MAEYTRRSTLTNDNAKIAAIILSTLGILFMLAMGFKILPFSLAVFVGVACFILARAVRRIGRERN